MPPLPEGPVRPPPAPLTVDHDRPVLFQAAPAEYFRPLAYLSEDLAALGVDLRVVHFEDLMMLDDAPAGGTWLMTACDALSPAERIHAAAVARRLCDGGARVLNDPATARDRVQAIRQLHAAGLASYTCWSPAAGERPDRFPVFLRGATGHRGAREAILDDAAAAEAALAQALEEGEVLSDLVFIEFRGAPRRPGHWQKHAAFRIGDAIVRGLTINDTTWHAKNGALGVARPEDYAAELAEIDPYPHAEAVLRVFDALDLEFGRLDFAFVDGRLEPYEVNTAPTMRFGFDHPDPDRKEAIARMHAAQVEALAALAARPSGTVRLKGAARRSQANPGHARRF